MSIRTIAIQSATQSLLLQELQFYAAVLLLAFIGVVIGDGTCCTVALGNKQ